MSVRPTYQTASEKCSLKRFRTLHLRLRHQERKRRPQATILYRITIEVRTETAMDALSEKKVGRIKMKRKKKPGGDQTDGGSQGHLDQVLLQVHRRRLSRLHSGTSRLYKETYRDSKSTMGKRGLLIRCGLRYHKNGRWTLKFKIKCIKGRRRSRRSRGTG